MMSTAHKRYHGDRPLITDRDKTRNLCVLNRAWRRSA
jgi:hypothetical protein